MFVLGIFEGCSIRVLRGLYQYDYLFVEKIEENRVNRAWEKGIFFVLGRSRAYSFFHSIYVAVLQGVVNRHVAVSVTNGLTEAENKPGKSA